MKTDCYLGSVNIIFCCFFYTASLTSARPAAGRATGGAKRKGQGATTLVMVPASVFPGEACRENGGKGWTATTSPHRKGTLRVTFTHARDDSGARFRPVHLKSTCVVPLPTPVKEGEPAPTLQRVGKPSAKRARGERGGRQTAPEQNRSGRAVLLKRRSPRGVARK